MRIPDLSINSPFACLSDLELGLLPYEPPVVYKFMERKFAEKLVSQGALRLGAIADYRRTEVHTGTVLDTGEGRQRFDLCEADLLYESPDVFDEDEWECFGTDAIVNQRTNAFMCGNVFHDSVGADRHLIYCLTSRLDGRLMAQLDTKYDVAVRIPSAIGFFIGVARYLIAGGVTKRPYIGRCIYDGSTKWQNPLNGRGKQIPRALQKSKRFASQEEIRMVFPTAGPPVGPIDVVVPAIVGLCEIIDITKLALAR